MKPLKQIAKLEPLLDHTSMTQEMAQQSGNLTALKQAVIAEAKSLGFDLVKFSKPQLDPRYLEVYDRWIAEGLQGDMEYMKKVEARRNISQLLPGAKTVIVLAMNYYRDQPELESGQGRVARYAYGRDYHKIIGKKLRKLENFVKNAYILNGFGQGIKETEQLKIEDSSRRLTKSYVDTGPILERAYAEQSGLGVIGKNGCLISREFGSWIFLSELITTIDFPKDSPAANYHSKSVCGNCTKCIDACPTGAIIAPGVVDSRLCISYLTIEHRKEIPAELAQKIAETKRLYGCDICQEVCPHNQARQKITAHGELTQPKIAGDYLDPKEEFENSLNSDEDFLKKYAGSPFMRIKKKGLARNLDALS